MRHPCPRSVQLADRMGDRTAVNGDEYITKFVGTKILLTPLTAVRPPKAFHNRGGGGGLGTDYPMRFVRVLVAEAGDVPQRNPRVHRCQASGRNEPLKRLVRWVGGRAGFSWSLDRPAVERWFSSARDGLPPVRSRPGVEARIFAGA